MRHQQKMKRRAMNPLKQILREEDKMSMKRLLSIGVVAAFTWFGLQGCTEAERDLGIGVIGEGGLAWVHLNARPVLHARVMRRPKYARHYLRWNLWSKVGLVRATVNAMD